MAENIGRRGFIAGGLAAILAGCATKPSLADIAGKAKQCYEDQDYVHAIRWLDDLLEQDPKNADALGARGWSYFQLNQLPEALENFDKSIALKPNVAEYRAKRGFAYTMRAMQSGPLLADSQRALDDYAQALKIDDTFADAYAGKGFAYVLLRNKEQAFDAFRTAKKLMGSGHALRYIKEAQVENAYVQLKNELGVKDEFY
jgi:tetratricopeptide (TPR) repeat protein